MGRVGKTKAHSHTSASFPSPRKATGCSARLGQYACVCISLLRMYCWRELACSGLLIPRGEGAWDPKRRWDDVSRCTPSCWLDLLLVCKKR